MKKSIKVLMAMMLLLCVGVSAFTFSACNNDNPAHIGGNVYLGRREGTVDIERMVELASDWRTLVEAGGVTDFTVYNTYFNRRNSMNGRTKLVVSGENHRHK